ncbi:uncharacterized protein PAE49_004207 [Odontesthes bonariensis]
MNTTVAENGSSSPTEMIQYHDTTLSIISATVNSIVSLPLNGYVIWLILRGLRETLAADFFSLNVAMSEILFSLCSFFYIVYVKQKSILCFQVFIFSLGLFYTARPCNNSVATMYRCANHLPSHCPLSSSHLSTSPLHLMHHAPLHSPLFQCCICVECYVGVVHPVIFLQYKHLRYKVASCCVAGLITLVSCTYHKHTFSNSLYLYGFFIQNVFFLLVMLFCCITVARALKHSGPGEKVKRRKRNAVKIRAFKIILLIMIFMTINLFSYVAVIPLQCCISPVDFNNAMVISMGLALASGFIQPLLHLHRSGKLICLRGL